MRNRKAILFDRDGVVNFRIVDDYVKDSKHFVFLKDFLSFFKLIKEKGYLAFLVTNQQGIGKGIMTEENLNNVFEYMQLELKMKTAYVFDDIFYCPELASTNSFYRKPNPGMLLEAIAKHGINIKESYMIGDSKSDIVAGKKAKLTTVLLTPLFSEESFGADFVYKNFTELSEIFD